MRDADMFLQHSMTDPQTGDQEGLPVAILEAMAHGLPVIATRHAGIPEAVEAGRSGHLTDEGATAEMAVYIAELARNAGARAALGRRGWERCAELFSWSRERDTLLRILGLHELGDWAGPRLDPSD
jgi:glycosyltransferase involved in cell wall biosynthesis